MPVGLRGQRDSRRHVVLVSQQWPHEEQVAVAQLRAAERVEVAERDGGEYHVLGVALVQHGDIVVLIVVDDAVHHLHEEHGDRQQEDHRPHDPADAQLVLHKDVVAAVEGAAAKKSGEGDVRCLFVFWLIVRFQIFAFLLVLGRLAISRPRHSLVVVVEAVLVRVAVRLVVCAEGDGACDSHHGVKPKNWSIVK